MNIQLYNNICISVLDIWPCIARGNEFVSIYTTMHMFYGLDKRIIYFLFMCSIIHMVCGLDECTKKYKNLIS
jgi:hypothetical protein